LKVSVFIVAQLKRNLVSTRNELKVLD